ERTERTQCISNSLTLAKQCRDSCRDWASTLLPDNTCLSCFQSAIACGVSETFRSPGYEKAYAVSSKGCLGWHATCMTSCSREMISSSLAHKISRDGRACAHSVQSGGGFETRPYAPPLR